MSTRRLFDDYTEALGYGRPNQTRSDRDANLAAWGCLFLILLYPIGLFLRGTVLQQLWSWFVVPLGVAAISLPWALGISGLVYMLTYQVHETRSSEKGAGSALASAALVMLGQPILGYVFGWVCHWWMA